MRVLEGRGDWRPGFRIESLRRYAFIGDSHAYGAGVAPDETLSANAERQMNELLPAWPVEAVNLGVCGYNLWNSWLAFKHGPQVYDGVVLALCDNDADLFHRSYHLIHPEPYETRWESANLFGAAVACCFDDIASFSQERSLPVAVVYYNAHGIRGQLRIGEIIGDLCASRGFPFVDTFAHYRDRNFAFADLFVSSADPHPSAMAHEAVGRHLVATLKRRGWFREDEASAIGAAPERILASARAMVETDQYPPDAALNWALRALDAKSRVAHRMQASGAEDDFSSAAARVTQALTTASRRWHMINRARALVGDVATGGYGIAWSLFRFQEEKLRLEELCFALGTGDSNRLATRLLEVGQARQIAPKTWPSDVAGFLDGCILDLLRFREALEGLRSLAAPAAVVSPEGEASMRADLETLARLAGRTEAECTELKTSFLRLERIFSDARPAFTEERTAHISSLIGAGFEGVQVALGFVPQLLAAIKQIRDTDCAAFTTVEVTISANATEGRQVCTLGGQVDYSVPNRLPCRDQGNFWPDGSTTVVKLHFPVFYAGRLGLRIFNPRAVNTPTVEGTIVKVEVYNGKNRRRIVKAASFYRNQDGRFVSPLVYLP
jgi:hypothetical protein